MNDLQTITNLKLDNSNMKMGEQLDFARRSIMVAKENAQRQINAIRRLENKNTSNSNKSDMLNKSNTISINSTVATGINTLSQNLSNMFEELGNVLGSSMSVSGETTSGGIVQGVAGGYDSKADRWTKFWQVYNLAKAAGDPHPLVTAGQWAVESGWGKKPSGKYNLFGVKGKYKGKGSKHVGYEGGAAQNFRDYSSYEESIKDHLNVKMNGKNFRNLGYATAKTDEEALDRIDGMYVDGKNSGGKYVNEYNRTIRSIMNDARKQGKISSGAGSIPINSSTTKVSASSSSGLVFDKNPVGIDPNLVKLLQDAYIVAKQQGITFKVPASGVLREAAEQNKYFRQGGSKIDGYKNIGRHQKGQALDISITSKGGDKDLKKVNDIVQNLARQRGLKITWGGTWKFYDPYHFQIENGNWDSHKNPALRTQGGLSGASATFGGGATYKKPNLKMMGTTSEKTAMNGRYVPNISADMQKEIEKISNYEFEKSSIKNAQEEKLIKGLVENVKKWKEENLTLPEIKRNITQYMNDNISIITDDMTTFKDLTKNIVDKIQTDLELSKEAYDKMVSQYLEDMNNLHFAFDEMRLKVESTSTDWVRAFNFVNTSEIGDNLLQSFNSMNENTAKINAKLKKMVVDIKINPNLVSMLNYLEENSNVNLRNDREKFEFLTDNNAMLKEFKQLEDRLFELGKDQFNNLGLDRLTLQNLSTEERNQFLAQVYTEISKQGQISNDMFLVSQNYNNILTLYKLLGQRIEENIEIKKQETEIMKSFNKIIINFSSKIKSISNSILNMENTRNLNNAINDFKLYSVDQKSVV